MSVAIVGKGTPLTLLEDAELAPHLAALADEAGGGAACARLLRAQPKHRGAGAC